MCVSFFSRCGESLGQAEASPMNDEQFASAFGNAAQDYERGRPGYPPEAIDALIRELGLERRSVVVDLAAGTGKLTRDLTGRFDRVIAIEPLAEMREQLARTARRPRRSTEPPSECP